MTGMSITPNMLMQEEHRNLSRDKYLSPEERRKRFRVGWMWFTEDQWLFNRTTKDAMWKVLESDKFKLYDLMKVIRVKDDWLDLDRDTPIPVNYDLLLFIWNNYMRIHKNFKPPVFYRPFIKSIGIFVLVLYREDTAYIERFGGMIDHILYDRYDMWAKRDKKSRIEAMCELRDWWYKEDWRLRGKDKLLRLFNMIIDKYDKEPFVRMSIDYIIDMLLANKSRWNRADGLFRPETWFPRGKGQINYIVHGRLA